MHLYVRVGRQPSDRAGCGAAGQAASRQPAYRANLTCREMSGSHSRDPRPRPASTGSDQ